MVTSVVLEDDVVPRLSLRSVASLMRQVCGHVCRCVRWPSRPLRAAWRLTSTLALRWWYVTRLNIGWTRVRCWQRRQDACPVQGG